MTLFSPYVTVPPVLAESLTRVRQRLHDACQRCGRDPNAVTLVGVTKTIPVERVRSAIALGLTDVGENRVQEAQDKFPHLPAGVRRHLIGHLQRNKATHAVELFDVIHSVDSAKLVEELERQRAARCPDAPPLEALVQVNVSGEATKFGCRPEDAASIANAVATSPHLRLAGLMTIAPLADDPEAARPIFRSLRLLRDQLQQTFPKPLRLSMGMSNDFEVAIEEGADLVRIGTAIFGERVTTP